MFLKGDKDLMRARVASRRGHYMPASLIDSQFAALETPEAEQDVITLAADANIEHACSRVIRELSAHS